MSARPKLILVVDDNEPQRYATAHALESAGFRVSEAATGEAALASIAAQPPDLIILDVHLPDIGGQEVCRHLKADPATGRIPVLQISATLTTPQDRAAGLAGGADGYLNHPVEDVELIATVRSLLRMAEAETERSHLWAQVNAQAELLKAVMASSPDHLYLFDADGRYAYVNAAAAVALRLEPHQIVGKKWQDLGFPAAIMVPIQQQVEAVFSSGERYHGETEFPVGGETRQYDYVLSPVFKDGKITVVLCGVRDITERKLALENERSARQAAEAAESRIAAILESITDAFFTLDRQWRFAYVNREAERLLRQGRKHLLGQVVWDLFPQADAFRRQYELALTENRAVHFEEFYGPLGNIWFEVHAYPSAEGLSIYFRDVTARKRDEAALHYAKEVAERSVAQLRTVVEAMNEALIVFDPQGRLVLCNPAFGSMYDLGDAHPKSRDEFQRILQLQDVRGHVLAPSEWPTVRAFRGETVLNYELHVRNTVTGREFDSRHTAVPVRDGSGNILLVVLTVEDVTPAKQAELEQRLAKDLAETSAAQLSATIESMAEGVLVVDPQLRVLLKNTAFARLYGVSSSAELPDHISEYLKIVSISEMNGRPLAPEQLPIRRALAGDVVRDCELRLVRRASGTEILARYNATPVTDGGGNVVMAVLTVEDITERRAIEQALRQSDERMRVAAMAAEIGVWTLDVRTGQVIVGANWKRLFGVPPQTEVAYDTWLNAVHPDDRQRAHEALAVAMRERRDFNADYRVVWPDGEVRWIVDRGRGIYDEAGQCVSMSGVNVDITERKRAEEAQRRTADALRESEARFRTLADAIPQLAWVAHADGYLYWYNRRWYEYTGTTPEQMEGWGWQRVHDPTILPVVLERWKASIATGEPFDMVFPLRGADGMFRPFLTRIVPLKDEQGRVLQWFGTNTDISEQKAAEDALRASEAEARARAAELTAIMDVVPAITFIAHDPQCRWMTSNRITHELLRVPLGANTSKSAPDGQSPAVFRAMRDGRELAPDELPVQQAAATGRAIRNAELTLAFPDGASRDIFGNAVPLFDDKGQVRGAVGAFVDITERKQAEQALRNTEKLAAAGRLAAVLAHEINNPMAAVTNLIYLLSADSELSPAARTYVDLAQQELARIAHITKQMLGFCREPALPEIMRFTDVLDGVLDLYDPRIRRAGVTVDRRYDFHEPVRSFAGEVRQVFSNLVVNALDAMGDSGGLLRLRVRHAEDSSGRQGVRIAIADTGSGIPPADRKRIFEPFFTTKGERGTGLGLWVTQGILQKHGGTLRVRSSTRAGRSGTCFSMFFPCETVGDVARGAGAE